MYGNLLSVAVYKVWCKACQFVVSALCDVRSSTVTSWGLTKLILRNKAKAEIEPSAIRFPSATPPLNQYYSPLEL